MAAISPSCTKSSKILDVLMPTTVEAAAGKWQYNFAALPDAGYGPHIDDIIWTYTGGAAHADATFAGKNSAGYWTYYTLLDDAYTPSAITLKIGSTVIGSYTYSITVLKGTGVTGATIYRLLDNSYIESSTAMAGDTVSVSITLESSVTSVITPYASYTDAGGTVHQVTLTAVNDTSWTFTMPGGNVVVATNAEAGGGGGDYGIFLTPQSYSGNITAKETADRVVEFITQKLESQGYTILTNFDYFKQQYNVLDGFLISRLPHRNEFSGNFTVAIPARYIDSLPIACVETTNTGYGYNIVYSIIGGNKLNDIAIQSRDVAAVVGYGIYEGHFTVGRDIQFSTGVTVIPPVTGSILVDYTLTPSTAGEIDGPETLESSANFSFTFTLYPGYQFKSCSALSVVRGENNWNQFIPADTVVSSSGNVYTVAVSNLNENLNGVNISVNCVDTRDPNNTPTTPTTTNTPQGGNGDHDLTSDIVTPSDVPSLSAHDSGLLTVFRPSLSELQALGRYLWTNITDFIENLQKWFSNPMDFIISLSVVPCIPSVGTTRNVQIGLWETNVAMPPVTSQWVTIDCGTIQVTNFYGSALDYSPYTKISAMLPFIGSVQLDTDEIMGKNVQLVYRIDIVSGHCVAMIVVNRTVLYQFSGDCAASIPLTGADWSRVYGAIVGAGLGVAAVGVANSSIAAAGKLAEGYAAAKEIDTTSKAAEALGAVSSGMKGIPGVARAREIALANLERAASLDIAANAGSRASAIASQMRIHAISNTVSAVMSGKLQVGHAGSLSGNAGLIGTRKPYLLIELPNQSLAEDYKHIMGYPTNVSGMVGDFTGYTEFEQVIPAVAATDEELSEIIDILKGGVYL